MPRIVIATRQATFASCFLGFFSELKAVYQYDKSLNLINVFQSRNEAARALGFHKAGIGHACHQRKGF